MSQAQRKSIAEAHGGAARFTDYSVPDVGIRDIFEPESVWQAWLDVEVALAQAEASLGLVPAAAAERIAVCGTLESLDMDRVLQALRTQGHPVMPLVEELARVAGEEAGGWVHWGATSQNITQTGNALLVRRAQLKIRDLMIRILEALAILADSTADLVMPGRTHGQHAVPITFGLKVATWIERRSSLPCPA